MHGSKYFIAFILILNVIVGCGRKEDMRVEPSQKSSTITTPGNKSLLRIMGHWYGEGKKELLVR